MDAITQCGEQHSYHVGITGGTKEKKGVHTLERESEEQK